MCQQFPIKFRNIFLCIYIFSLKDNNSWYFEIMSFASTKLLFSGKGGQICWSQK